MEKKNPIEEARRYVDNAKDLLREKGELDPETHSYSDRKYVKMAGNNLAPISPTTNKLLLSVEIRNC